MTTDVVNHFFDAFRRIRESAYPDLFFEGVDVGRWLSLAVEPQLASHVRFRIDKGECFHLERVGIFSRTAGAMVNVASDALVSASSVFPGSEGLISERKLVDSDHKGIGVHTAHTGQPEWVMLVFPQPIQIDLIEVRNRSGAYAPRAWTLVVELSLDGQAWTEVYNHKERLADFLRTLERRLSVEHTFTFEEWKFATGLLQIASRFYAGDRSQLDAVVETFKSVDPSLPRLVRERLNAEVFSTYRMRMAAHGLTRPFLYWDESEKKEYLEDSAKILSALATISSYVCFGFGVVLGFVRNGDLIPHDDDVDIIIAFDRAECGTLTLGLQRVEELLRGLGYSVTGTHLSHRWVAQKGGRATDVFVGLVEGDKVSWYPSHRGSLLSKDVFPPLETTLYGVPCQLPRHPFNYLEAVYGPAWRHPDVAFKHPWDGNEYKDIA